MPRGGARPGAGRKVGWRKPGTDVADMSARRKAQALDSFLEMSQQYARKRKRSDAPELNPFQLPQMPPNVVPKNAKHQLAQDQSLMDNLSWASGQWAAGVFNSIEGEGLLFPGYAYLSELAQRPEYRIFAETIATEMTRKWIRLKSVAEDEEVEKKKEEGDKDSEDDQFAGGGAEDRFPFESDDKDQDEEGSDPDRDTKDKSDKTDKIKELEDELDRLEVKEHFKIAAIHDAFFGRAHLFMEFEGNDVDALRGELSTDIGNGRDSEGSEAKIAAGSFKRLQNVEPVWTYAQNYNATNPLAADWYFPTLWYVMGREVHISRLLTFVGRPVPDMLKPAYMFGGISLSQLAKPYVDIWLNTRQNIGNLIQAFSVMVLKTDLSTLLQPGGIGTLYQRAAAFNALRDNQGLMMVNNETEDFQNVSVPLGSLDKLQAQAQEHMASVARIPLVKFTGIQPTGLNASSDGEIRVFYDTIHAMQESFFRPNLTRVIDFAMINLWGKVDDEITFDFEPLWALTEKEEAEVRKMDAETDDILVNGCAALHPEEVRKRVAADPDSLYADIDVEDVPDVPDDPGQGELPFGGQPGSKINTRGTEAFHGANEGGAGGDKSPIPFAVGDEAHFEEAKHPRDSDGKFTSGGAGSGGGGANAAPKTKKEIIHKMLIEGTTPTDLMKALGWPTISMPAQAFLAKMKLEKFKENGVTKYKGTPMSAEEFEQAKTEKAEKAKKKAEAKAQLNPVEAIQKAMETFEEKIEPPPPPEPEKPAAPPPPPPAPPASPQEIAIARKSTPVPKKSDPDENKLVQAFNEKYAGKDLIDIGALNQKVADYKQMQLAITAIQQAKMEIAKIAAEKAAAEAAAKAKAAAEEAKAKNKEVMEALGITESEATGFHALVEMMGGSTKSLLDSFKQYEKIAKTYGYPITGFQGALIHNYTGAGYTKINSALRAGSWTEAQHVYVKLVNKALRAMPTYKGTVKRGASLTSDQQAVYKKGNVVEMRAFTSSSPTKPWSGNTQYVIKAIGKHGAHVGKLSAHPGEDEVVFSARTFFKVTEVHHQHGHAMQVHLEEMED